MFASSTLRPDALGLVIGEDVVVTLTYDLGNSADVRLTFQRLGGPPPLARVTKVESLDESALVVKSFEENRIVLHAKEAGTFRYRVYATVEAPLKSFPVEVELAVVAATPFTYRVPAAFSCDAGVVQGTDLVVPIELHTADRNLLHGEPRGIRITPKPTRVEVLQDAVVFRVPAAPTIVLEGPATAPFLGSRVDSKGRLKIKTLRPKDVTSWRIDVPPDGGWFHEDRFVGVRPSGSACGYAQAQVETRSPAVCSVVVENGPLLGSTARLRLHKEGRCELALNGTAILGKGVVLAAAATAVMAAEAKSRHGGRGGRSFGGDSDD